MRFNGTKKKEESGKFVAGEGKKYVCESASNKQTI